VCALSWNGCVSDVPHDNPLDPLSANPLSGASLSGRIVLKNQLSVGVAGAFVAIVPGSTVAITDSLGYFAFQNPPTNIQQLIVRKVNYSSDTVAVTLARGESRQLTIDINAVPTVSSVRIITRKIDQWWPNPIYFGTITATAEDLNGISDLDSVWVSIDSLSFGMSYSVSDKNFQAVVTASQMPTNSLEWLIGRQFIVRARDKMKAVGVSTPAYAARLIDEEPLPVYPALQDTASSSPEFRWTPPSAVFPFSYSITVVRLDAGIQTVVWTQTGIGSYLTAYQYPSVLQAGYYFWTISIVDEYGNIAQSKESSFVVNN
jgi:hypothetical protein